MEPHHSSLSVKKLMVGRANGETEIIDDTETGARTENRSERGKMKRQKVTNATARSNEERKVQLNLVSGGGKHAGDIPLDTRKRIGRYGG